ncbi:MAG: DUF1501 domain-containing protein, partial [Pirellulales bacterium]
MNQFRESRTAYLPSRRELLRYSGMGLGSLALAGLLDQQGLTAPPAAGDESNSTHPLAPRRPHFAAKAKS